MTDDPRARKVSVELIVVPHSATRFGVPAVGQKVGLCSGLGPHGLRRHLKKQGRPSRELSGARQGESSRE
jgi:hypothetical protein